MHRSGRHRGRRGKCRNDRLRRRRAAVRGGEHARPGTAMSRCSRDTRLVCLPCQPSPAACASGFSITGAVSTKTLISPPACSMSQRPSCLQPRLDHVVIIVALRIDRDARRACAAQDRKRILVRAVIDAEHDDGADLGPQNSRVARGVGVCRHPVHVAVGAGSEEFLQALGGLRVASGRAKPMASKPWARAAAR